MVAGLSDKAMTMALAAGAGLILAVIVAKKMGAIPSVPEIAYTAGGAVVDAVDGVISGAVVGTGKIFGIPETSRTQCQRDIAAGNMWDASFSCPAKEFLQAAWGQYKF